MLVIGVALHRKYIRQIIVFCIKFGFKVDVSAIHINDKHLLICCYPNVHIDGVEWLKKFMKKRHTQCQKHMRSVKIYNKFEEYGDNWRENLINWMLSPTVFRHNIFRWVKYTWHNDDDIIIVCDVYDEWKTLYTVRHAEHDVDISNNLGRSTACHIQLLLPPAYLNGIFFRSWFFIVLFINYTRDISGKNL